MSDFNNYFHVEYRINCTFNYVLLSFEWLISSTAASALCACSLHVDDVSSHCAVGSFCGNCHHGMIQSKRGNPNEMENGWNALCFPWLRVMLQLKNEGYVDGMGCGHAALGRSEIEREAKLQSQAVIMMVPLEHAPRLILWVIKLLPLSSHIRHWVSIEVSLEEKSCLLGEDKTDRQTDSHYYLYLTLNGSRAHRFPTIVREPWSSDGTKGLPSGLGFKINRGIFTSAKNIREIEISRVMQPKLIRVQRDVEAFSPPWHVWILAFNPSAQHTLN